MYTVLFFIWCFICSDIVILVTVISYPVHTVSGFTLFFDIWKMKKGWRDDEDEDLFNFNF